MSAINMDLDKRFNFNFKKKVKIGGKTYNVVFNDAMDRALLDLQVEVQDFYDQQTKKTDEFEEMTVEQRKAYLADQYKQVVHDAEKTLDEVFGVQGAGKSIYEFYDKQSYALFRTIQVLREEKEKLDGTAKEQQRRKHQARIEQYTGRKERVKNHVNTHKKRAK